MYRDASTTRYYVHLQFNIIIYYASCIVFPVKVVDECRSSWTPANSCFPVTGFCVFIISKSLVSEKLQPHWHEWTHRSRWQYWPKPKKNSLYSTKTHCPPALERQGSSPNTYDSTRFRFCIVKTIVFRRLFGCPSESNNECSRADEIYGRFVLICPGRTGRKRNVMCYESRFAIKLPGTDRRCIGSSEPLCGGVALFSGHINYTGKTLLAEERCEIIRKTVYDAVYVRYCLNSTPSTP